ncbi:MAG: hypothetical protein AB1746_07175 [Candidatus Zixiibacteriota bacterium]
MDYIALFVGIIGGGASVYALFIARPRSKSWRSVCNAIRKIIHELETKSFIPDLVILYGRGGAIFGGLIAGNMGNIPVALFDREVINTDGTINTNPIHIDSLHYIKGKKILFVTGEVITGNQLLSAQKLIKKYMPDGLKTASYYVCRTSCCYPDHYFIESNTKVKVPWRLSSKYRYTSKLTVLD